MCYYTSFSSDWGKTENVENKDFSICNIWKSTILGQWLAMADVVKLKISSEIGSYPR